MYRAFLKIVKILKDKHLLVLLVQFFAISWKKMLPESCRSRMVRILAAIWRLVPPCSTAAHLLHALTTSSPVSPSFTLSSYYLTNISKFMRFYLISLACTSKPTPLFPFSQFLLTSSAQQVTLYVLATATLRASLPLFSLFLSLFLFSVLYSFSRLAHFNCISIYTHTYIFLCSNRRKLEFCLACT